MVKNVLSDIGGIGPGYELHTWPEQFKKPEPLSDPAAVPTPPTSAPAPTPAAPKTEVKKAGDSKK